VSDAQHVSATGAFRTHHGDLLVWQSMVRAGSHSVRDDHSVLKWWDQSFEPGERTSTGRSNPTRTFTLSARTLRVDEEARGDVANAMPLVEIVEDVARSTPQVLVSDTFGSPSLGYAHVVVLAAKESELVQLLAWADDDAEDPLPAVGCRHPIVTLRPRGGGYWIGLFDLGMSVA